MLSHCSNSALIVCAVLINNQTFLFAAFLWHSRIKKNEFYHYDIEMPIYMYFRAVSGYPVGDLVKILLSLDVTGSSWMPGTKARTRTLDFLLMEHLMYLKSVLATCNLTTMFLLQIS